MGQSDVAVRCAKRQCDSVMRQNGNAAIWQCATATPRRSDIATWRHRNTAPPQLRNTATPYHRNPATLRRRVGVVGAAVPRCRYVPSGCVA